MLAVPDTAHKQPLFVAEVRFFIVDEVVNVTELIAREVR